MSAALFFFIFLQIKYFKLFFRWFERLAGTPQRFFFHFLSCSVLCTEQNLYRKSDVFSPPNHYVENVIMGIVWYSEIHRLLTQHLLSPKPHVNKTVILKLRTWLVFKCSLMINECFLVLESQMPAMQSHHWQNKSSQYVCKFQLTVQITEESISSECLLNISKYFLLFQLQGST